MTMNKMILIAGLFLSLIWQSNCLGGIREVEDLAERTVLANKAFQELEKASNHLMARRIVEV